MLKRIVENPYVKLGVGLVLFLSGLSEMWDSLQEDAPRLTLGLHHGVTVYALHHLLSGLVELFEGAERATD